VLAENRHKKLTAFAEKWLGQKAEERGRLLLVFCGRRATANLISDFKRLFNERARQEKLAHASYALRGVAPRAA